MGGEIYSPFGPPPFFFLSFCPDSFVIKSSSPFPPYIVVHVSSGVGDMRCSFALLRLLLLLGDDLALVAADGVGPLIQTTGQANQSENHEALLDLEGQRPKGLDLVSSEQIDLGAVVDESEHQEVLSDGDQVEGKEGVREGLEDGLGEGKREGGGLEGGQGQGADNVDGQGDSIHGQGRLGGTDKGGGVGRGMSLGGNQISSGGEPAAKGDSGAVDGQDRDECVGVEEDRAGHGDGKRLMMMKG